MSSNLPPGVTEGMIPGNRPEDIAWDEFYEWFEDQCCDHGITVDQAYEICKRGISVLCDKAIKERKDGK